MSKRPINNTMVMKATFLGENPSMGFKPGESYYIKSDVYTKHKLLMEDDKFIMVKNLKGNNHCMYSRIETFLMNWRVDELLQWDTEKNEPVE